MKNIIKTLSRIEYKFQRDIEEANKQLKNIGINVYDEVGIQKSFLKIICELKEIYKKLPNDKNSDIIKSSVSQSIAGIMDANTLMYIMESEVH